MNEIDYPSLLHAVQECIDDSISASYDFESLLRTAALCWDNTAVEVKGKDFTMVFDIVAYELLDYTGFDG